MGVLTIVLGELKVLGNKLSSGLIRREHRVLNVRLDIRLGE